MEFERTPIDGVILVKPTVWRDPRGYFVETWQQTRYMEIGIALPFVQDNRSRSIKGTLRGLHFQRNFPQGKLVSVSRGSVFDVAVDIRKNSPTFGQWFGAELTEENQHQMWVAPGLAHGFCVTSDVADFSYKCTEYYHPEDDAGIRWNDPAIGIAWPIGTPILSAKDENAPLLKDADLGGL
ncbi:MAG: dTDP-4-dehydrorhamnose 3,5-epimerase [Desulfovibrio sp.]